MREIWTAWQRQAFKSLQVRQQEKEEFNINRPLIWIAGGLMLGEVLALHKAAWIAVVFFGGAAAAGRELYRRSEGKSRAVWAAVLLFSVFFGYGRMETEKQWVKDCLGLGLDGRYIWIEGTAAAVAERTGFTGEGLHLTMENCRVLAEEEAGSKGKLQNIGRVEVFLDQKPHQILWPGDVCKVYGQMEICEGSANPGEFDFQIYYLGFRSCYRMYGEDAIKQDLQKNQLKGFLYKIRNRGGQVLDSLLDEQDSGVMKAMILGDKTGMDENIKGLYQENGIAHILAISGLHISLIGAGFYRLLRKAGLGFAPAAAAGAIVLFLYGTMVGFSASSFRAVVMMTVFFLSEYLGRTYDMTSAAGLAGILIMVHRPFQILHSGFQLSFGAVLSISILGKYLEGVIKPPKGICQQMVSGAAVQIGTCPIVLYHFYQYPIYGFLLNLAVIPLMTYGVISGILGIFLGSIYMPLGRAALGTCHYVLKFYEFLCKEGSRLPMSNLIMGRPALWQILLYCLILFIGLLLIRSRESLKGLFLAALCMCLLFSLHPELRRLDENLTVTFLDVGQGDGILIEKGNTSVLIDGGSTDEKNLGEQVLEPCLKSKGISRIDYAIISHGDEDHISGIRYLLAENGGIRIENLVLPVLGREEDIAKELEELMQSHSFTSKGKVWEMKAGDRIKAGDLTFTCLYPEIEDKAENRNQQSLVLAMTYGDLNLLFTGDTEAVCEKRMMERPFVKEQIRRADVLKTAHHGSESATSQDFLDIADNLKWAVISCGKNNQYGHPSKDVVQRMEEKGIEVFVTWEKGAVVLKNRKNLTKTLRFSFFSYRKSFKFLQPE